MNPRPPIPTPSMPRETLVPLVASMLTDLCRVNDLRPSSVISKFHATSVPTVSVHDYLSRVAHSARCSDTCLILTLVYIDRIQCHPQFRVCSLNVHRLIITALTVAAKYFDDVYYNNAFYAGIGGVSCKELNGLELEFLFMVGFSLFVTEEEYVQYDSAIQAHARARHMDAMAARLQPQLAQAVEWQRMKLAQEQAQLQARVQAQAQALAQQRARACPVSAQDSPASMASTEDEVDLSVRGGSSQASSLAGSSRGTRDASLPCSPCQAMSPAVSQGQPAAAGVSTSAAHCASARVPMCDEQPAPLKTFDTRQSMNTAPSPNVCSAAGSIFWAGAPVQVENPAF